MDRRPADRGRPATPGLAPLDRLRFAARLGRFAIARTGAVPFESIETVHLKPRNLVFIVNSKCACTSVKVALIQSIDPDLSLSFGNVHLFDYASFRPDLIEGRRHWSRSRFASFIRGKTVFTVFRSPYDRIISCYLDHASGKNPIYSNLNGRDLRTMPAAVRGFGLPQTVSFEEFVRHVAAIPDRLADRHFRAQSATIDFPGSECCQFFLNQDELSREWSERPEFRGLPPLGRHNVNPSTIKSGVEITPELDPLIRRRYARDLAIWDRIREGRGAVVPS